MRYSRAVANGTKSGDAFCDAPRLYQGLSAVLRQARPRDLLGLADHSRRPGLNEEQEDRLRKELEAILSLPHAQACDKVDKLDSEHKERRSWVWAQLGESPYAVALEPLGRLAKRPRPRWAAPRLKPLPQTMRPTAGAATVRRWRRSVA